MFGFLFVCIRLLVRKSIQLSAQKSMELKGSSLLLGLLWTGLFYTQSDYVISFQVYFLTFDCLHVNVMGYSLGFSGLLHFALCVSPK